MSESILEKTKTAIEKIKYPRLLAVGAAVLLIGGGVAAYWALVPKTLPGNVPWGAKLIPQDAIAVISVSTNKAQWQKLREFGTPESRSLFEQQLQQLSDRFLSANGYDYEKDIQPWVGFEVMIAFLPAHASASPSTTPNETSAPTGKESVAFVLPIDNLGRAKQLLQNPKPIKGGKWSDRTYKDVKLKETLGLTEGNYSIALLEDRFLIVTTEPKASDLIIDTYKGSPSLATTPGYTEALGQIENSGAFARLYVNMPASLATAAMHSVRSFPPQAKAPLQQQQGFAANMGLEQEGIRLQGVSWLKPDSEQKQVVENKAKELLNRLPADTLIMTSGSNLQRLWQDYARGAQTNPLAFLSPDWLQKAVASNTGMDWDKDFMAWMSGEFSLSQIPAAPENSKQFSTGLVLMVQSNDRRLAEKSFKQLDGVMSSRYKFKVEEAKVGDRPVVNWTSEYGGLTLSHGWLDGNVAFLTMGAPVANVITPKPKTPLALSEQFQKAVPSQFEASSGNFFIDINPTLNANQLIFSSLPSGPKTVVSAIRTIGVTAFISSDRMTRYDIFAALKKEAKPVAKPSPAKPASPARSPNSSPSKPSAKPSPLVSPSKRPVSPTPAATSSPSQPPVRPTPAVTASPSQPSASPTPAVTSSPSQSPATRSPEPFIRPSGQASPTPAPGNSPPQPQPTLSPFISPPASPAASPLQSPTPSP